MKLRPAKKIAGLVLAAGRSSRMAPRNKLLELIGDKAIVARVVETACAAGVYPLVVVTGFEAERVADTVRDMKVEIAHNPHFGEGMSTSLQAGLRALPADTDGALILLGDMPWVERRDLETLIATFANSDARAICVPVRRGKAGNPVLWGAGYFSEMMRLTGDKGAKQLLARHREKVIEVPASSDGIFSDIDTPSDLASL